MDDASALIYFGAPNAQAFLQAWRLRAEDRGALVINVLPGRAADQCGIIPGDLIVTVNGVEIATASQFQRLVAAMHADAEVTLDLLRAGREKKLIVRLGARPREYPLAFLETPEAEAPKAAPPEGTALLVTPEEAAKALGGDFALGLPRTRTTMRRSSSTAKAPSPMRKGCCSPARSRSGRAILSARASEMKSSDSAASRSPRRWGLRTQF